MFLLGFGIEAGVTSDRLLFGFCAFLRGDCRRHPYAGLTEIVARMVSDVGGQEAAGWDRLLNACNASGFPWLLHRLAPWRS